MLTKIAKNEKDRINTLRKYDILDTPPDGTFDEFTKLAANLLNVPIAIISMVDTDRIWFKSKYGVDIPQIDRDPGLCASAILSKEFYEVENATKDPRTITNPLVAGEFGLRFYAAYPLETRKGYNLGTLCIIDKKPRKLSKSEKEILKSLRNLVMDQIELRYSARAAYLNHNRMLSIFAHDLKNPLATINMASDIIQKKKADPEVVMNMCGHITKSGKSSLRIIKELLESAELNTGEIELELTKFNIGELLYEVVESNQILADRKGQHLSLSIETKIDIEADKTKLEEVMDNLINNAIKYSPQDKEISIRLQEKEKSFSLMVKDNGPGLTKADKKKLFTRFSKLSAQPTGSEISTGLGLYIAKCLVQAHNGKIWGESEGKNKGATFWLQIPID